MRFICMGDAHMDKYPTSRIDDFEQTKREKIDEIKTIAKQNNAKAIIELGDFLNKDIVSSEALSLIMEMWKDNDININDLIFDIISGKKKIDDLEDNLKKNLFTLMIGVMGNHEAIGGECSTLPKTSLNVLIKSGFLTLATKENPIYFKDEDGFTVAITGSNYNHKIDGDDKSAYIVKEKLGDFHIHIVHGMLMPKSYGELFKHTTISEIAYETKADLTINGHDHIGYDLIKEDGKYFINPGAIFRLSADDDEIKRKPKVLIIDISSEGFSIEEHYLSTAKEGKDVLSKEHIIKNKNKDRKIQDIANMINKANLSKGIDITEIVDKIADNEGISKEIKDETIELITQKMKELDTPFTPKGDYIIERMELENFMSHKHTILDFDEGLNILCGESRNGKQIA